ncbi:TPA: LPXTG cell wall anchor domain-containing protein [Streptococcus suis]|nr:LPXTG cell wall anchor domain-containing protein [Streptococcus suis]
MKKSSLIALITLSGLVLNQAKVLADETAFPVDSTATVTVETPVTPAPTVPVEPSTVSETSQPSLPTPTVDPVDNTVPTTPTTEPSQEPSTEEPSSSETSTSTEPVLPTEPGLTTTTEQPTSETKEEKQEEVKPEQPSEEPISSDRTTATVPTIDGGTATIPTDVTIPTNNPNISAQAAQNAGASQVGTTSRVTGQVVSNVTQEAPIITHTGYQIISTVNSQVVIQGTDGTVATVSAEVVGGKVNADKTISIKTASGEMTTLPSTGEKENLLLTLTGFGLLAMVGHYLKKRIRKA